MPSENLTRSWTWQLYVSFFPQHAMVTLVNFKSNEIGGQQICSLAMVQLQQNVTLTVAKFGTIIVNVLHQNLRSW